MIPLPASKLRRLDQPDSARDRLVSFCPPTVYRDWGTGVRRTRGSACSIIEISACWYHETEYSS